MNKKTVIYTSLFGDYDDLHHITNPDISCDYICFTDQKFIQAKNWSIIYVEHSEDPVFMNRKYKMLPHLYLKDYESSLYIDSNIIIKGEISELIYNVLKRYSIAIPRHFMRDCAYTEASFCLEHNKINTDTYNNLILNHFEKEGFPKNFGLGENNIIIRKHNDASIINVMDEWWDCFKNIAKRDQLTLMYLLWKNNIDFLLMKESSRNRNPYFDYYLHKSLLSGSKAKTKLLLMSARRDRNVFNKLIGKILDKI